MLGSLDVLACGETLGAPNVAGELVGWFVSNCDGGFETPTLGGALDGFTGYSTEGEIEWGIDVESSCAPDGLLECFVDGLVESISEGAIKGKISGAALGVTDGTLEDAIEGGLLGFCVGLNLDRSDGLTDGLLE